MSILLALITYVYHDERFKKLQVFLTCRYRHQKHAQLHIQFAVLHPALRTYKGIFFTFQTQTLPDLRSSYFPEDLWQIEFCTKRNLLRIWWTMYVYTTKSSWYLKHRNTKAWPATIWGPNRLCYRPAVFFRHPLLTVFSFPQRGAGGS